MFAVEPHSSGGMRLAAIAGEPEERERRRNERSRGQTGSEQQLMSLRRWFALDFFSFFLSEVICSHSANSPMGSRSLCAMTESRRCAELSHMAP